MKKILMLFCVLAFTLTSCGDKKKEEVKKEVETVKEEVKKEVEEVTTTTNADAKDDKVAMGKKLFTEKTCTSCHGVDTKIVGPALKDIAKAYSEKSGNIVKFLKGNADAIVDTDPGQVAIMKANIDGMLKDVTPEEMQAIAAYIRSVK